MEVMERRPGSQRRSWPWLRAVASATARPWPPAGVDKVTVTLFTDEIIRLDTRCHMRYREMGGQWSTC
jgi:hypothetical protein